MNTYHKSDIPPHLLEHFESAELGLEATPAEYVAAMVEVFALVRELLADDGVLWLNLGDSYANTNKGHNSNGFGNLTGSNLKNKDGFKPNRHTPLPDGLKAKDLIGIPWRVAFALQADGWYLRQDIIWHKPNPMPESVTDRCTKAHEYIFMLTKNARYYYDNEAIKELGVTDENRPAGVVRDREYNYDSKQAVIQKRDKQRGHSRRHAGFNERWDAMSKEEQCSGFRNKRSVWTVATKPYTGAHFATFPPALIEPCILAGSRPGDTVLDPFFGSGTTGQVSQQLGRQWIGCELNPEYAALQQERVAQAGLTFT